MNTPRFFRANIPASHFGSVRIKIVGVVTWIGTIIGFLLLIACSKNNDWREELIVDPSHSNHDLLSILKETVKESVTDTDELRTAMGGEYLKKTIHFVFDIN